MVSADVLAGMPEIALPEGVDGQAETDPPGKAEDGPSPAANRQGGRKEQQARNALLAFQGLPPCSMN